MVFLHRYLWYVIPYLMFACSGTLLSNSLLCRITFLTMKTCLSVAWHCRMFQHSCSRIGEPDFWCMSRHRNCLIKLPATFLTIVSHCCLFNPSMRIIHFEWNIWYPVETGSWLQSQMDMLCSISLNIYHCGLHSDPALKPSCSFHFSDQHTPYGEQEK